MDYEVLRFRLQVRRDRAFLAAKADAERQKGLLRVRIGRDFAMGVSDVYPGESRERVEQREVAS